LLSDQFGEADSIMSKRMHLTEAQQEEFKGLHAIVDGLHTVAEEVKGDVTRLEQYGYMSASGDVPALPKQYLLGGIVSLIGEHLPLTALLDLAQMAQAEHDLITEIEQEEEAGA
jgi:hypothetical protein